MGDMADYHDPDMSLRHPHDDVPEDPPTEVLLRYEFPEPMGIENVFVWSHHVPREGDVLVHDKIPYQIAKVTWRTGQYSRLISIKVFR